MTRVPPTRDLTKHDWRVVVTYAVGEHDARRLHESPEDVSVVLGEHNVEIMGIGCFRCEKTLEEALGRPCPGEPPGTLEYVVR